VDGGNVHVPKDSVSSSIMTHREKRAMTYHENARIPVSGGPNIGGDEEGRSVPKKGNQRGLKRVVKERVVRFRGERSLTQGPRACGYA